MHDLTPFEARQPLATLAFYQAVKQQRLAHGLLLVGQPVDTMLAMVQHLYRAMACEQPVETLTACRQCRSCRWMAQNAHPHFMTLSPLSFFVEEDSQGGVHPLTVEQANKLLAKPPTQIRVGQIRYLQEQLSHKAGAYPRMAVFCDATAETATPDAPKPESLPPYDFAALPAADGQQWIPRHLNLSLFNTQSANRFLKTLEEPGPNTFFVFLAQQPDDVLPTIASRCQVIPFQSEGNTHTGCAEPIATFWTQWFTNPQHPAVGLKQWLTMTRQNGFKAEQALTHTLVWIRQNQRHHWQAFDQATQWFDFARKIQKVEEMLSHHVSEEHALLTLFC